MSAVWRAPETHSGPELRPTLFLDRDGVLIRDMDYLDDPAQVEILSGVIEALVMARDEGFQLIGLSNQSGIGRGMFSREDMEKVMIRLEDLLTPASLDGFYYCPHEPGAGCACRKPAQGMLEEASRSFHWDPEKTWMIGDKSSDVALARQAGFGAFLVLTGHGSQQEEKVLDQFDGDPQVRIVADLPAAVRAILNRNPEGNPK